VSKTEDQNNSSSSSEKAKNIPHATSGSPPSKRKLKGKLLNFVNHGITPFLFLNVLIECKNLIKICTFLAIVIYGALHPNQC
jgi:hypothetical protein